MTNFFVHKPQNYPKNNELHTIATKLSKDKARSLNGSQMKARSYVYLRSRARMLRDTVGLFERAVKVVYNNAQASPPPPLH